MEYKIFPFVKEDAQDEAKGIVKGYGSTFGGKPDSYGDIIVEGAFKDSIESNFRGGLGLPMLWQHMSDEPAGVWERVGENKKGLYVEGPMEKDSEIGKHRFNLLKMGAVKGLSIGFDLPRGEDGKLDGDAYEIDENKKVRYLKKINLWEVSLVTFAANTRAKITGVKAFEEAKTVREMEKVLRESGLSKSQALYIASLCKPGLRDSGREVEGSELLDSLKQVRVALQERSAINELIRTLRDVNKTLTV